MPYKEHPAFNCKKAENSKLWRYMNFDKFMYTIKYSKLFFCCLDELSSIDKSEGLFPRLNIDLYNKEFDRIDVINQEIFKSSLFWDIIRYSIKDIWESKTYRGQFAVNCWHMNDQENYLMWKSYTGCKNSVCIQTNLDSIKECIKKTKEDIYIGCVVYENEYNNELQPIPGREIELYNIAATKRKYFMQENELRLIYHRDADRNLFDDFSRRIHDDGVAGYYEGDKFKLTGTDADNVALHRRFCKEVMLAKTISKGISIDIDLNRLIKKVYVSYNSDDYFDSMVKKELECVNIDVPVIRSGI